MEENESPNTRGPTIALSFRLRRGVAKRVEDACGSISCTRAEFFRAAIEDLLAKKEKMIIEKLETYGSREPRCR